MLDDLFAEHFPEFGEIEFAPAPPLRGSEARASGFPTAGYVYVIRSQYGFKIGKTINLRERTRLFSVKLPFPTALEHYAWFDDYTLAERNLHQMFSGKRLEGEWFDLSEDDVAHIRTFGQGAAVEGLSLQAR